MKNQIELELNETLWIRPVNATSPMEYKSLPVERLYKSKLDPDVSVVRVQDGLVIAYRDPFPSRTDSGLLVRESVAIGWIGKGKNQLNPIFWEYQYPYPENIGELSKEIRSWIESLPVEQCEKLAPFVFTETPTLNW